PQYGATLRASHGACSTAGCSTNGSYDPTDLAGMITGCDAKGATRGAANSHRSDSCFKGRAEEGNTWPSSLE
ncbi:hypothetical protein KB219_33845, partial [Pseudomonas aeruginosa]|nr:hypothetical protein [Pseudomonas aeruginosa]